MAKVQIEARNTVSIIFLSKTKSKKDIILKKKAALAKQLGKPVAAEVYPFQKFWVAEDYHQDYERYNRDNPLCAKM